MTRLENVYREKVVPVLQKEFAYSSPMQIPGIVKISLNIGLGSASQNNKLMEEAMNELSVIAGQKAVMTRAKKSIAAFKLREGMPIGCRVTLRKERTLGIKEHAIFPEMEADRIENPKGMNITIVTTATTDKEGKFLLEQLGMPFRK